MPEGSRGGCHSLLLLAIVSVACSRPAGGEITPIYDVKTGKLAQLVYDDNRDGRADTWSYMDGARIVRIELDTNHDGIIDRWEYYDAAGKLEKVGQSRAGDGHVDTWMYPNPDGSIARVEQAARGDGRVTRREYYDAGQLARVEEDRDGDGRADRWETYSGSVLTGVAFDTSGQGVPDRRFVYKADGSLDHIEDVSGNPLDSASAPVRRGTPR